VALITEQEAVDHLHIILETDGNSPEAIIDPRYADLQLKMVQAEAAVLDYIEMEEADLTASGVSQNWIVLVRAAIMLVLSGLWEDREGNGDGDYFKDNGAVARLLKRIRYPAIA
jgi:hypothetical protein